MSIHFKHLQKLIGKKFVFFFIFLIISIIFCSILETIGIGLIIPVIKIIFSEVNYHNIFQAQIKLHESFSFSILTILIFVVTFFILKNFFLFFNLWLQNKFFSDYSNFLSNLVLKKYLERGILFFKANNSSTILRNILNETKQLSRNYLKAIIDLISETILFLSILIFMVIFDPYLSIMLLSICSFFSIIYLYFSKNIILDLGKKRAEYDSSKIKIVQEIVHGIDQVKISFRENFFLKIFNYFNFQSNQNILKQNLISGVPKLFLEVLVIVFIILFISLSMSNKILIEELIIKIGILIAISIKVMPAISKFLVAIQTLRYSQASLNIIFEIIDFKQKVKYSNEKYKSSNIIEFKNVAFSYPNKEKNIIENLNLKIEKGKIFGIYGKSGCGKSTLGLLLTSLIEPKFGKICINYKNLEHLNYDWLSKIGHVSQNTFLQTDNLYKNIAFGVNEESINKERINYLLNFLDLDELKTNLEKKGGVIQEFGKDISSGQKQRVGLARALYFNPEVLILDEATNSLDPKNEERILKKMQEIKKDKFIIIISHNEKVLNYCDEIFNFETKSFDKF